MMPPPKNAMEIFQFLDKSNCRECGEKTCLAFAGAVFTGQKKIEACPKLDQSVVARFSYETANQQPSDPNSEDDIQVLKDKIAGIDLAMAAQKIGADFSNGRLCLKIMGKDFCVDNKGNFHTDIHINPWVVGPFVDHILHSKGLAVSGNWMSFRELRNGKEMYPLFQKRCEEILKRVADIYTDLFDDMVHIFNGRQVKKQFESDISVILHPLPKIPIMICYWLPEEGLASSLNLYFDETADKNLDINSIFSLGTGLAQMFSKLALRHGYPV